MTTTTRWISADLESLPSDGKRYEIIDGELHMSKQPHWYHQYVCVSLSSAIHVWNKSAGLGKVNAAPSVIFADDDDVAPDLVWLSNERLSTGLQDDGKLHVAPELVIEVLSPGGVNDRRDREAKLKLYSRRGVSEYWIVNWRQRLVEVFRRHDGHLSISATLFEPDSIESPLMPGLSISVQSLFEDVPRFHDTH